MYPLIQREVYEESRYEELTLQTEKGNSGGGEQVDVVMGDFYCCCLIVARHALRPKEHSDHPKGSSRHRSQQPFFFQLPWLPTYSIIILDCGRLNRF